ncbi:MAG: hypothetical protein AB1796_06905 [Bacillota bacterium]
MPCALSAAGAFDFDVDGAAVFDGLQVGQAGVAAQALQVVENEPPLPLQKLLDLDADIRLFIRTVFLFFLLCISNLHVLPGQLFGKLLYAFYNCRCKLYNLSEAGSV